MAGSSRRRAERDAREAPPREVGEVIRQILSEAGMRHGLALGRLARGWAGVVGPRLAGETAPIRLENGALTVAARTQGWAAQLRFLSDEVRGRANAALGAEEVRSIRVVVVDGRGGRRGGPEGGR